MKNTIFAYTLLCLLAGSVFAAEAPPDPDGPAQAPEEDGPTTPPGTPSYLSAPTWDGDGAFAVVWGAGSSASFYELQQQKDGGAWISAGTFASSERDAWIVVSSSGDYVYRVRACNLSLCSGYRTGNVVEVEMPPTEQPGDFRVRMDEASFNNALAAITAARGINFADYSGNFGLSAWYINLENATLDLQPNNQVVLHARARSVSMIDLWLFDFVIVENVDAVLIGNLVVDPLDGGFRLVFQGDQVGIRLSGDLPDWLEDIVSSGASQYFSAFVDLDVSPGTTLLPDVALEHFDQITPGLLTNDNEVMLYFDLSNNLPPVASFSASVQDTTVTLTDQSTDPDGSIVSRTWSLGNGDQTTATRPTYNYGQSGTFTVTLTVVDDQGVSDSHSQTITVTQPASAPPVASIATTVSGSGKTATYAFNGSASHDPDATDMLTWYKWEIISSVYGGSVFQGASQTTASYTHFGPGSLTVKLTVTDNEGDTHTRTRFYSVCPPFYSSCGGEGPLDP